MLLAEGGVHIIVATPGDEFRLWLPGKEPPKIGTPLAAAIDLDAHTAERAAAAQRFWRAISGLPAQSGLLPEVPLRRRHAMMLWALDLKRAGQTQRDIARMLLDAAARRDWADAAERSQVRRLLRDADRLARGGYLNLLRPPKRLRPTAV